MLLGEALPTPEQLRAATTKAQREADQRRKQEQEELNRKRLEEVRVLKEEDVPRFISAIDRSLESRLKNPKEHSNLRTYIGTFSGVEGGLDDYRSYVLPALESHYQDQGYTTRVEEDHTIEFGSDGGFPGPIHVHFHVSW